MIEATCCLKFVLTCIVSWSASLLLIFAVVTIEKLHLRVRVPIFWLVNWYLKLYFNCMYVNLHQCMENVPSQILKW